MKQTLLLCALFYLFISCTFIYPGGDKKKNDNQVPRILVNDMYNYIAVNQIKMWMSNNGDGSYNPSVGAGFYWPGGAIGTKTAVYLDGLVYGGYVDGALRINGNTSRPALQAGKILPSGLADDPTLPKYRVYKILKGWESLPPGLERDQYELDFNEWPMLDGAPYTDVNGNGAPDPGIDLPEYTGDETAWYVSNDLDPSRTTFTYGTMPIGIEFQTTVFAYNNIILGDMIFKKYLIINKSNNAVEDMYLAYYADMDLGDASDDFAGCDTILNMGYVFNATPSDGIYGTPPPAIGYDLLQGPIVPGISDDSAAFRGRYIKGYKNLPMTAFNFYINSTSPSNIYRMPVQGSLLGANQLYNNFKGLIRTGDPYIDPHTTLPVVFPLSGDPVGQTGWYQGQGWPGGFQMGDKHVLICSGPFTFSPGDTQEVIIGIVVGMGIHNINSITKLKEKDLVMQDFYNSWILTDVDDKRNVLNYTLNQNYPNPFNPSTIISFSLPVRDCVRLKVYDILGNEITVLLQDELDSGIHRVVFEPSRYSSTITSGVYFYRLETSEVTRTGKMVFLK